jgi:hypothetical protein
MLRIGVAFAICLVAQGATAATADRTANARCSISGYLKDPAGADVRSAPRADAPVVGRLPPPAPLEPGGDERFGAEFDILDARDGWLLIAKAEVESEEQFKTVFEGPGWLPNDKVDFVIGSQELRVAPANTAKIIAKLTGEAANGEGYGPDSFETLAVHACKSHFVELTITPPHGALGFGARMRGWVNKVCSNQKTTCDPSVADSPGDGR